MKKSFALFALIFALPAAASQAPAVTQDDVKQDLVASYPMTAIAIDAIKDQADPSCEGLGQISDEVAKLADEVIANPALVNAPGVSYATAIEKDVSDFRGFCDGKGAVKKGDSAAAIETMTRIRATMEKLWYCVFPRE